MSAPTGRDQQSVTTREIVWATTLSLVLLMGILGTLWLRTAMQSQAQSLHAEHGRAVALANRSLQVKRHVDRESNPATLARDAGALHMRPQAVPKFVRAGHRKTRETSGRHRHTRHTARHHVAGRSGDAARCD